MQGVFDREHQMPASGQAGKRALRGLALDEWLVLAPLVGVTLLAKLALPPLGAMGIAIGGLLNFAIMLIALAWGRFSVDPWLAVGFGFFFAYAGICPLMTGQDFSPGSLAFLLMLHLPYLVAPRRAEPLQAGVVKRFSGLCWFLAWCGIGQHVLQLVAGPTWAFPIESFMPASLLVQAFNTQGVLAYGSELYRTNGVFLLEASFFSQLLAVGLALEVALHQRWIRAGVMALAMVLSSSGTGFLVLALCLPVLALAYRRWQLVPLLVVGAAVLMLASEQLNLDVMLNRAGEFESEGSSAFSRFVGAFYLFDELLWNDPVKAMLGYGAGAFRDFAPKVSVVVAEMAIPKMIFEYGLIGGGAYFGLLSWVVFRSRAPLILRVAVFATFFLNGALTVFSHGLALALLAWSHPPNGTRASAP